MSDLLTELASRSRALSAEERVRLMDLLLESLQGDAQADEDAWNREIARRVAAHELGQGSLHEADEVMAELQRLLP